MTPEFAPQTGPNVGRSLCVVPSCDVSQGVYPFWVQEGIIMQASGEGPGDPAALARIWVTLCFRIDSAGFCDEEAPPLRLGVLHPGPISQIEDQSNTLLDENFWLNRAVNYTEGRGIRVRDDGLIDLTHKRPPLHDLSIDFDPESYPVRGVTPLPLEVATGQSHTEPQHDRCVLSADGLEGEHPALQVVVPRELCPEPGSTRDFIIRWSFKTSKVERVGGEASFPVYGTRRTFEHLRRSIRRSAKEMTPERRSFYREFEGHVVHPTYDVIMVGVPDHHVYDVDIGNAHRKTESFRLDKFPETERPPIVFSFTPENPDFLINIRAWRVKDAVCGD